MIFDHSGSEPKARCRSLAEYVMGQSVELGRAATSLGGDATGRLHQPPALDQAAEILLVQMQSQ